MSYGPRSYQSEFLQTFYPILSDWRTAPIKRGMLVWHRRAGKDLTALQFAEAAMKTRSGVYFHFLPTYGQAKRVVWEGKDKAGTPFLSYFDPRLIEDKHETELKITYRASNLAPHGSIYQLVGGDSIDNLVGTNPVGCIFSEFPLMNPKAWDLVRPILRENGGWAVFIFTPRGKNHAYKLWLSAREDPAWFTSLKTVDDTRRDAPGEDGGPVLTPEDIEQERRSGMTEELIQQEYYCSFEGAMEGAYFADQLATAEREGRITDFPIDPSIPVDTAWDFGMDDATAIWFSQAVSPHEHRVIDYLESSGHGLDWYIRELRRRGYSYGRHYAPHDAKVRSYETGNTRVQFAARQGLHFEVQTKLSNEDYIEASRRLIPVSIFHGARCEKGIDALKSYRREKDEKLGTWKNTPVHDWASHGADAWKTRAVAWKSQLGGGTSWAETRYHLHRKHEAQAEYAEGLDTSWKRDKPAEARDPDSVQVEHGDDWWRQ